MVERRGRIDAEVVVAASELYAVMPSPRRVRVTGRLDVMGASQGVLKVDVKPGEIVTALWNGDEPVECLREFFNRDVVIEGIAVFRPSGSLLRIDAEAIAPASTQDEFFRGIPTVQRDYHKLAQLRAGEKCAYAQLRGSLAGGESDEEFQAALATLRYADLRGLAGRDVGVQGSASVRRTLHVGADVGLVAISRKDRSSGWGGNSRRGSTPSNDGC